MSLEKIENLEGRIMKVLEVVKTLKYEKEELLRRVDALESELEARTEELARAKADIEGVQSLQEELERVTDERNRVRGRIGSLLDELEKVEI